MRYLFLVLLLCYWVPNLIAQDIANYRPKISEVSYSSIGGYSAFSENDKETRILTDRLWSYRLGIPIILKSKTLFGVQLKHTELSYSSSPASGSPEELYNSLNEGKLYNSGLNFLFQQQLKNDKKLTVIAVSELASDRWNLDKYSSRYYTATSIQNNPNDRVKWSYGLVLNYALGVINVYPTVTYQKVLSEKWLFEANLPSDIQLRHHPNKKTHLIAKVKLNNWRYNVTDALQSEMNQLTLQRADIFVSLTLEKDLLEWLWFSIDLSYVNNMTYYVAKPGERIRNALQEYRITDASHLQFNLFLVPPNELWNGISGQ